MAKQKSNKKRPATPAHEETSREFLMMTTEPEDGEELGADDGPEAD